MSTVVISLTALAYVVPWYLNYTPPPPLPHHGHLLDSKTKKPLLRREALDAFERMRVHIKTGCLSDSPAVSLYFEKGNDQLTGVTLYRCARGTNDLEGFHKHMRSLIEWCVGAGLGSDLLLKFIYRWNLDRNISNRVLNGSIGDFYDQPIIEAIQVRWVCVRTQLRVCRGISVKLFVVLRVTFVFPPLGDRHYPRLSICLCFFSTSALLTMLPRCFYFEPHPFCRK